MMLAVLFQPLTPYKKKIRKLKEWTRNIKEWTQKTN